MLRSRCFALAAALLVVGCAKKSTTEPEVDLVAAFNRQEAVWNSQGITNYTMEQERLCLCSERKKARLTVRNGAVTDAVYVETGDIVPVGIRGYYYTVPQLFAHIRAQYATAPNVMEVLWHATLGYPAQVTIDPKKEITDDGYVINTSNVVKLTTAR